MELVKDEDDGQFAGFTTTLTQEGRSYLMDSSNKYYLKHMTQEVAKGQVLTIDSYDGDSWWLGNCPQTSS